MELYSYHIFMFPFKWECRLGKEKGFSEKINPKNLKINQEGGWERMSDPKTPEYKVELFNERNYFYDFVHPVLYDSLSDENQIIWHFEREEAYRTELEYQIKIIANGEFTYNLKLKSLVLNLYSTGTGILVFYLENSRYKQFDDVLRINQFGRRVFPPFLGKTLGIKEPKQKELADYICIHGLKGNPEKYYEEFEMYSPQMSWKPARFIENLVYDLSPDIDFEPVTDDRMHVLCWFGSNEIGQNIKSGKYWKNERTESEWYKFVFVDVGSPMCQNNEMREKLIKDHTYFRWQNYGSLHGISRYSFVYLTEENPGFLLDHFRTIYARMVELSLVQRASILKFSDEVAVLSKLKGKKGLADEISDLYRQYIRFVNQVFFREVTAQEQGIELYAMIQEKMKIPEQVKDLDTEIGELHQYAILLEDKDRNRSLETLSLLGAAFIIPTFIVGFFGMNIIEMKETVKKPVIFENWWPMLFGLLLAPFCIYWSIRRKGWKRMALLALALLAILANIFLVFKP